jgi:hypothetical protein
MRIKNLIDANSVFSTLRGPLVGVGLTAFPRIVPAYFIEDYRLITLRKTQDLQLLREKMPIFCLEEENPPDRVSGIGRSDALLAQGPVKAYLSSLRDPRSLFTYQSYPSLERLAKREGWRLLANPAQLRLRAGGRSFFMRMVKTLALPQIPGAIHPIRVLGLKDYTDWTDSLGPQLVIQLPDVRQGGGRGTFFIRSRGDYDGIREKLGGGYWRENTLESVSIRKLINGISASMALCLTRYGILMSRLQRQLVDLPYVRGESEDGIFCGHSWGDDPWTQEARKNAADQARRIGTYLWNMGIKGIIGIDFIVEEATHTPYPVEINPRLTGAFPMMSLLHLKDGRVPMEVFHILELMDMPYSMDVGELNEQYAVPLRGSHLLIFQLSGEKKIQGRRVKPGLYELDPGKQTPLFLKPAASYDAFQNEKQFIVIDGPPVSDNFEAISKDSLFRLCHLLFPCPVTDPKGELSPHAHFAAQWVHRRLTPEAGI